MKNGKLKIVLDWAWFHMVVKPLCMLMFIAVEALWIWFLYKVFSWLFK